MQNIVVTGAAGFIGFHVSKKLLDMGYSVHGIDNLNDYYDPKLKQARLAILQGYDSFHFDHLDISNYEQLKTCIKSSNSKTVIHLAAQAGVRYSIENPFTYVTSNVMGHLNILEVCKDIPDFDRLIYASSSSVYGNTDKTPFSIHDRIDKPVSLYAATKFMDELMSYTYWELYGLKTIGLRFFTVYGPYGRPDMAPFKFTKKIMEGDTIDVYNHGDLRRDFTYIDDIVDGVIRCLSLKSKSSRETDKKIENYPRIYNLGNNKPVKLMDFIGILEKWTGIPANKRMLDMQKGDVYETYADITESVADLGYEPKTSLDEGLRKTVEWYRDFYKV